MSAWSDMKVGAISESEYRQACEDEDRRDRARMEREMAEDAFNDFCKDCEHYENRVGCTVGFGFNNPCDYFDDFRNGW